MVIIKTLGQDTFSWNPNAFNKKGHWFLLAETGSYIRAATKEEMGKLGKPKKQDEVSITDSTEKKMSYKQASQIRKKSLKDLITEKLVEDKGILTSIKSGISEKMQARSTGFKEKFDPLNIAKMLTGNLGSALLGRMTGRSKEDISYFAGDKKAKEAKPKPAYVNEKLSKSDVGLYSAISEGNTQSMKKGDGIATILARMYNLIKAEQINSLKRYQIEKSFRKIHEKEKEKRNKELINAIKSLGSFAVVKTEKKEETGGLFDFIKGLIESAKNMLLGIISNIWNGLWSMLGPLMTLVGEIAGLLGLKKAFDKLRGIKTPTVPSEPKPGTAEPKPAEPKPAEPKPAEPKPAEPKPGEKPAEGEKGEKKTGEKKPDKTAEKATKKGKEKYEEEKKATKVEKVEEKPKATKMSKVLKGAKGVLKYFTKLPFIGGIAGAFEMMDVMKKGIADREEGKIDDKQLREIMVSSAAQIIAAGAGTSMGATIGATIGSVGGPIGAFLGGATGAALGYVGGKKAGKTISEKLFEHIANSSGEVEPIITTTPEENNKPVESVTTETPAAKGSSSNMNQSAPSSTPTTSPTATPPASKVTPVSSGGSRTDSQLESTMSKNAEIKMAAAPAMNTTIIDNSQSIGVKSGGSGGVAIDGSVSPRIDDPTLLRVQRQNKRPV
jgi:hypothetical protein